jgi:hypothetical protein
MHTRDLSNKTAGLAAGDQPDRLRSIAELSLANCAQALFAGHIGNGTPRTTTTGGGDRLCYSPTTRCTEIVEGFESRAQPLSIDLHGLADEQVVTLYSPRGNQLARQSRGDPQCRIDAADCKQRVQHTLPPLKIEVLDIPLQ